MPHKYWIYIITNFTNSVLYTGVTNNLARRIYEHKSGQIESAFSKKYRLYKLIWMEEFSNIEEAIAAEKKIKGWVRRKKEELIKKTNPSYKELEIY